MGKTREDIIVIAIIMIGCMIIAYIGFVQYKKSINIEITTVNWEGHEIKYIPVLSKKHLWLATEDYLFIDDKLIAQTGGFKFQTGIDTKVELDQKHIRIKVEASTAWKTLCDLNCKLIIDDEVVYDGIVKTQFKKVYPL